MGSYCNLKIFPNDSETLNLIIGMDTCQYSIFLGKGLSDSSILEVGFVDLCFAE